MSAQNDGVSRFSAIPLSFNNTAYIQGKTYKDAGGIQDNGAVAIGKTQPDTALGLQNPTSAYMEVLGGSGIDFHTGTNTGGYFDYDARISISGPPTALGDATFTVQCGIFDLQASGAFKLNSTTGAVGQVIMADANGKAYWADLP